MSLIDPRILLIAGAWFASAAVSSTDADAEVSAAQTASSANEDSTGSSLNDIVATARKITDRLQDVPMGLAVVDAQT